MNDVESMSSNCQLMEPRGTRFVGAPSCYYLGRWEDHSNIIVVTEGPRWASRVFTMPNFPSMLDVWGPNRACIVFDRLDLLSRLLFVDTWVESVLSSSCAWWAGKNSSLNRVVWLPKGNFAFLGKDAPSVHLKATH